MRWYGAVSDPGKNGTRSERLKPVSRWPVIGWEGKWMPYLATVIKLTGLPAILEAEASWLRKEADIGAFQTNA